MNPSKQTIPDDEIDLREIILTLWKEKYLILIITLVFTVAGYTYGTLQPKVYQATITLRDAPVSIFKNYESLIPLQQEQQNIASSYNQEFKLNLSRLDNLLNFVEQNKKIDEFKSFLKTNNVDISVYFKGKFQTVIDKNNSVNQYALNFLNPLPGAEF
jgi:LPS O-antigen subunit length determinant protein (WzzB/FepE family)